ncbi:MAG TPA: hypothetical protein VFW11_17430 [Cyclobacteriaceae bacterium]|nr:hypothetical protein [Cyclobacteriaceae bacterium]
MKIHELTPGIYKIRKRDYTMPFGARRLRSQNHPVHLLRVMGSGDKKRYYIDHDQLGQHPTEFGDEYDVLSKYDGQPQVGNCTVTLKFADASGEQFEFVIHDAWSLRAVFDSMPWLHKPFGYLRRKNN